MKYIVNFTYSIVVDADDEDEAADKADSLIEDTDGEEIKNDLVWNDTVEVET